MNDISQRDAMRRLMDKPNLARDGAPKRTVESIPVKVGMKNRTAETSLLPGHSNPLDDAHDFTTLPKKIGQLPPHPAMPSRADRGQHIEGFGDAILDEASRLGRKPSSDKC